MRFPVGRATRSPAKFFRRVGDTIARESPMARPTTGERANGRNSQCPMPPTPRAPSNPPTPPAGGERGCPMPNAQCPMPHAQCPILNWLGSQDQTQLGMN
ncbi:MAG: hypothetical protein F6J93_03195 [Oscillatoria sp. SIO1A7]|nr:hypothetical protein [Oscillatoria sp. SIO1A7]